MPIADRRCSEPDDVVVHQCRHVSRYAGKRDRCNVGAVMSDIVEFNGRVAVRGRAREKESLVFEDHPFNVRVNVECRRTQESDQRLIALASEIDRKTRRR